ncbi:hypothetical protein FACS1894198_4510 [Clostridia bacterium]|nr:hypothetical protein FACS1894198_4510 [Clostridia bacterium]
MKTVNASTFRNNVFKYLGLVVSDNEIVNVPMEHGEVVLMNKDEYKSLKGTTNVSSESEAKSGIYPVDIKVDMLEYLIAQGYEGKELVKQFAELSEQMEMVDAKIDDEFSKLSKPLKHGDNNGWFMCDRAEDLWVDEGD